MSLVWACTRPAGPSVWELDVPKTKEAAVAFAVERSGEYAAAYGDEAVERQAAAYAAGASSAFMRLEMLPERRYRLVTGNGDQTFACAGRYERRGDVLELVPDPNAELDRPRDATVPDWRLLLDESAGTIIVHVPDYPSPVLARVN